MRQRRKAAPQRRLRAEVQIGNGQAGLVAAFGQQLAPGPENTAVPPGRPPVGMGAALVGGQHEALVFDSARG